MSVATKLAMKLRRIFAHLVQHAYEGAVEKNGVVC